MKKEKRTTEKVKIWALRKDWRGRTSAICSDDKLQPREQAIGGLWLWGGACTVGLYIIRAAASIFQHTPITNIADTLGCLPNRQNFPIFFLTKPWFRSYLTMYMVIQRRPVPSQDLHIKFIIGQSQLL